MLIGLSIRDLAVVESLDLEFDKGLTVLTGETGAGKSILLTALSLALGDRADSGYVRPGCQRAEINLEFDATDNPDASLWLQENALDSGSQCLIRRSVSRDGRSKAFVNDRPATLQSLQELSAKFVEIHGQHAHLSLLQNAEQLRLLDESAGNQTLLVKLNGLYQRWRQTREKLTERLQLADQQAARTELLGFQINELEQLELDNFDYQALVDEHGQRANLSNILDVGQSQLELLYENEQHSVNRILSEAVQALSGLGQYSPDLNAISQLLDEAQIQVGEAAQELRRHLESLDSDPNRFNWLEEQLGIIHNLTRKHHVEASGLPRLLEDLKIELEEFEQGSETIDSLRQSLQDLEAEYQTQASELSTRREKSARRLEQEITEMIQELGMPQGEFFIEIKPKPENEPKADGNEQIDFLVSANPGMPARPLGKVASGGELSRISLAIKVATISSKIVPTMIFDEVDAGIGGGVAQIVGNRLHALGQDRQVFCVTHLPQVAAQGNQHLLIEKLNNKGTTQSIVRKMSANQRKNEIARMLGGVNITQQTLKHAEEMLHWKPHA